jgi:hypothetical protein
MAFRQRDEIDRAYQLFEGSRNAVADAKRQLQLAEASKEVLITEALRADLLRQQGLLRQRTAHLQEKLREFEHSNHDVQVFRR